MAIELKNGILTASKGNMRSSLNATDFLQALKIVKTRRTTKNAGICRNVTETGLCTNNVMHVALMIGVLAENWDKYSGNYKYPVPSTVSQKNAESMYSFSERHWNKSTKYGHMRFELLDHCIAQIERLIALDTVQEKLLSDANKLITKVKKAGYVLSIDLVSENPLAMGNLTMKPTVRKSRGNY